MRHTSHTLSQSHRHRVHSLWGRAQTVLHCPPAPALEGDDGTHVRPGWPLTWRLSSRWLVKRPSLPFSLLPSQLLGRTSPSTAGWEHQGLRITQPGSTIRRKFHARQAQKHCQGAGHGVQCDTVWCPVAGVWWGAVPCGAGVHWENWSRAPLSPLEQWLKRSCPEWNHTAREWATVPKRQFI